MRGFFKQIAAIAVVLVIGLGLWVKFFPGSGAVLARFGFGGAQMQAGEAQAAGLAGGKGAQGQSGARGVGGQAAGGAQAGGAQAGSGRGGRGPRVSVVVVRPAGTEVLNDKVSALGTASARSSVTVVPQSGGRLAEVLIGSGAKVTAGEVIARLEAGAEQIAFEKAQLAYEDAQRSLQRNAALVKSKAVAETQSQAVELAAKVAELNLRTAKRDLEDRSIVAPISGVVGILDVTPGSEVTPQSVIARIEDATALRVDFWLPERLSGAVSVGDPVEMVAVARPQEVLAAQVVAVDTQVYAASGTYRVQAELDNTSGSLQPGMALTVSLKFKGETFVSVDPLSVLWGSDGSYVWRVVDGHAQKAMVRIVQRNTETVLVAGEVAAGDAVITEGLDGLKAGAEVKIFGAPEPEAAAAGGQGDGTIGGGGKGKRRDKTAPAGN